MHRYSLDRFKKAQTAEPFSVNTGTVVPAAAAVSSTQTRSSFTYLQAHNSLSSSAINNQNSSPVPQSVPVTEPSTASSTSTGGGQSSWQPPDWAVEPKPGLYWLDVVKDGEVVDKINLEKRRNIFGRQAIMCDFVLDHPSVSRQHAAVVQHKNGSVYVIDLGSVHGTFVANERLSKDSPVEIEVGQSLKFAASTRSYILRKGEVQTPQISQLPVNFTLPPPPDPADEEAVVAYNTLLNRLSMSQQTEGASGMNKKPISKSKSIERPSKKLKKARVTFRDQFNGVLVEVVGISDGADVSTEPGPLGVKEGSLVGRFDNLVEITVIPKGKEAVTKTSENQSARGVTEKLQQFIEKVKSPGKGSLYDDLITVSNPWAKPGDNEAVSVKNAKAGKDENSEMVSRQSSGTMDDDLDDLFGDS
ncbi:hypothetical protein KP509_31G002900 [Ceratopteris richardii]|nr:hypothetical protein KP509_31G002900 [Ceratopteris richardii]